MDAEATAQLLSRAHRELERRINRQPPDFPALPEIPAARYSDARLFELERQFLFAKQWLFAGVLSELPEVGNYKVWKSSGAPILIVRARDQEIRAFYNVCRHRGASIVDALAGCVRNFRCNFHSWTYDLNGTLLSVPDQHEFPNLDMASHGLIELRCELWGNLIFVNKDSHASPLKEHLGKAMPELAHFDFCKRQKICEMSMDFDCNWKVAIDAFAESYHLFRTHSETVAPVFESHGQVLRLWPNGHSFMLTAAKREARANWIMDTTSTDPRHVLTRTEQLSVTIFPNIIMALGEFVFPIFSFWPTGPQTTRFEAVLTTPNEVTELERLSAQTAIAQLEVILREDASNMGAIQESVRADVLPGIPLGCQERRIYQFHEEIDRQIGASRIPMDLQVIPTTGAFVEI